MFYYTIHTCTQETYVKICSTCGDIYCKSLSKQYTFFILLLHSILYALLIFWFCTLYLFILFPLWTFPLNILDLIWKRFGYSQLWLLQPASSQNRPRLYITYMPDPTSLIHFSSVFPKKAWIVLHKTDLNLIWMVWSGFGQTHLVWKQAGVQESPGPVFGRMQPVHYQFPTFSLGSVLPQTSKIILCKTSPDLI